MRKIIGVAAASILVIVACKKEDPGATGGGTTLTSIKYQSDKLPARGTKAVSQKAVKGGSGPNQVNPESHQAYEEDTDRDMRKLANVDKVDCAALPDNVAECDGDKFYYCDDKKLWVVDCASEAKMGGGESGTCWEGENFVDCLAKGTATDGSKVSCDFSQTICCADDGNCYSPK
jgi:hypothetical protein